MRRDANKWVFIEIQRPEFNHFHVLFLLTIIPRSVPKYSKTLSLLQVNVHMKLHNKYIGDKINIVAM